MGERDGYEYVDWAPGDEAGCALRICTACQAEALSVRDFLVPTEDAVIEGLESEPIASLSSEHHGWQWKMSASLD